MYARGEVDEVDEEHPEEEYYGMSYIQSSSGVSELGFLDTSEEDEEDEENEPAQDDPIPEEEFEGDADAEEDIVAEKEIDNDFEYVCPLVRSSAADHLSHQASRPRHQVQKRPQQNRSSCQRLGYQHRR